MQTHKKRDKLPLLTYSYNAKSYSSYMDQRQQYMDSICTYYWWRHG